MSVLLEAAPSPSLRDQIEVIGERDDGLTIAYVPTRLVYTEDVPVNDEHVEELAASMCVGVAGQSTTALAVGE